MVTAQDQTQAMATGTTVSTAPAMAKVLATATKLAPKTAVLRLASHALQEKECEGQLPPKGAAMV